MKKTLLLFGLLIAFVGVMAQQQVSVKELKNYVDTKPIRTNVDKDMQMSTPHNPYVMNLKAGSETILGITNYDLQTNQSIQNRIYRWADGTIGGTWTKGSSAVSFSDRGTGYNYYDGSSWGAQPSGAIESVRTGWPSYTPLGTNGELVVSHNGSTGLVLSTRTTKGTGTWTQSTLLGPPVSDGTATSTALLWPRVVTVGDTIHVLACTESNAGYLWQGVQTAIVYYRSCDAGANWDIRDSVLPGMGSADFYGFGGDCYAWAEPKDGILAFVAGDNWVDLFMMKSTDGGANWTKTTLFDHPYPFYNDDVVTDTIFVSDGSLAAAIDNSGNVHVATGVMRVLDETIGDEQSSYFPGTDGIMYWNETMSSVFTDMDPEGPDSTFIIARNIDTDFNDSILIVGGIDGIPKYFLSMTSMPQLHIDDNDDIYLTFSSIREDLWDLVAQHYNHVWARKSLDGGVTWSDYTDLTHDNMQTYDYFECVFASVAPLSDNDIHFVYQRDDQPGMHIRGDEDVASLNEIIYSAYPKADIGIQNWTSINEKPVLNDVSVYPNPASENAQLVISANKAADIQVQVYNIMGQLVNTFNDEIITGGVHRFTLNVESLKTGVYFVHVNTANQSITSKLIVQ
jgi:hypothetical protein